MPLFNRVTIVGLGLIGGSIGMAIKRHRVATTVVGLSRKRSTLRRAKARGAIDIGTTDAKRAVRGADLVILATPVETIVPLAKRLAPWMPKGSVLTDVGSTKGQIVSVLERTMPTQVAFVGAHPLAGSEQRGIAAADAGLFRGSVCIVTQTARTNRHALQNVRRMWSALVPQVLTMDPQRHDRLVASLSHLPHLVAFCLVEATNRQILGLAPRSFLDVTRVAKSDPELWDDIFLTNRSALVTAMSQFERRWRVLRTSVARSDRTTLHRFLINAYAKRHAIQNS